MLGTYSVSNIWYAIINRFVHRNLYIYVHMYVCNLLSYFLKISTLSRSHPFLEEYNLFSTVSICISLAATQSKLIASWKTRELTLLRWVLKEWVWRIGVWIPQFLLPSCDNSEAYIYTLSKNFPWHCVQQPTIVNAPFINHLLPVSHPCFFPGGLCTSQINELHLNFYLWDCF